jgi:riboflavin synthase
MFTGIIRHVGKVLASQAAASGRRLTIDLGPLAAGLAAGESVAVSGACLTACGVAGSRAQFDVIRETLTRTTLGGLGVGARVNLERSLQLGQGLDGHLVQGHVDGLATLRRVRTGAEHVMQFAATADLTDLMIAKGSVAVDGVSLTLVDVAADSFSVSLIPTTLAETTLGKLRPGDGVNIETDVIGKYVRKYLKGISTSGSNVTMDKLREHGFLD